MAAFTYSTAYSAAAGGDASLQQRCVVSGVKTAQNVYNEGTGVTGHTARAVFATKVLNAPQSYGQVFAFIASMSAPIFAAGTATDTDIDNALSAAWNVLAGA